MTCTKPWCVIVGGTDCEKMEDECLMYISPSCSNCVDLHLPSSWMLRSRRPHEQDWRALFCIMPEPETFLYNFLYIHIMAHSTTLLPPRLGEWKQDWSLNTVFNFWFWLLQCLIFVSGLAHFLRLKEKGRTVKDSEQNSGPDDFSSVCFSSDSYRLTSSYLCVYGCIKYNSICSGNWISK